MKRILLLVAALVSLVFAIPASAQPLPGSVNGVTVFGIGSASAPAGSATMEILLADVQAMYSGMPMMPEAEATPGAAATGLASPVADAIAAVEGVTGVAIAIPSYTPVYSGMGTVASISFEVANPTQDSLAGIVATATRTAAPGGLSVAYVGARFTTGDCASLEREARQAALDNARSQADIQADLMGIELGEVVAVFDQNLGFGMDSPAGGCEAEAGWSSLAGGPFESASLPAFDPATDPVEVTVTRAISVTWEIAGEGTTPIT